MLTPQETALLMDHGSLQIHHTIHIITTTLAIPNKLPCALKTKSSYQLLRYLPLCA